MRTKDTTNYIGQKFRRLTVLAAPSRRKGERQLWTCRCDCGNIRNFVAKNVKKNHTKSCGCLKNAPTHGLSGSPEYHVWEAMVARCTNPKCPEFPNYGGRGVTICERWRKFESFYAEMGPRPTSKHSIDRINNEGDYEVANCHWTTRDKQNRNKRNNHFLTLNGVTKCISDWAEQGNVSCGLLSYRIRIKRMDLKQALAIPPRPYKSRIRSSSLESAVASRS